METGKQPQRLPSLGLDELLAELQVRLQAVLATRDRVNALFDAVVAVGTNLDIEVVLRGIVEVAVSLVNARYGAMGVIGARRLMEQAPGALGCLYNRFELERRFQPRRLCCTVAVHDFGYPAVSSPVALKYLSRLKRWS